MLTRMALRSPMSWSRACAIVRYCAALSTSVDGVATRTSSTSRSTRIDRPSGSDRNDPITRATKRAAVTASSHGRNEGFDASCRTRRTTCPSRVSQSRTSVGPLAGRREGSVVGSSEASPVVDSPSSMKTRPDHTPAPHQPAARSRPSAVIVTTTFPARPGDGTPEFVLTLASSIPGYDVTVIAPRMPGAAGEAVHDGVRVRRVAYFPRRWEGLATDAIMPTLRAAPWRVVEAPFLVAALLLATVREVRRRRASVLNAHWIVPGRLIGLVVRALTRVPVVVTVHGADAYTMRGRAGRWLKARVLRRAAADLPVSRDIARTLQLGDDVPVLRMGVDTAAIRAAVGDRAPVPGQLVYIGRLADKKGVDVLVDAVARCEGARLDVLGDGPERAALEARAAAAGVAERVRFHGKVPRSQVLAALARAQVVVIPSRVGADGDMEGTPVEIGRAHV